VRFTGAGLGEARSQHRGAAESGGHGYGGKEFRMEMPLQQVMWDVGAGLRRRLCSCAQKHRREERCSEGVHRSIAMDRSDGNIGCG
jgi:hypothetical protein